MDDASVDEQITASPEFRESRVFKSSVSKADEGVYQCETGNVYGSGVAKFSQVQVITRTTVNIVNSAAGLEGKVTFFDTSLAESFLSQLEPRNTKWAIKSSSSQ